MGMDFIIVLLPCAAVVCLKKNHWGRAVLDILFPVVIVSPRSTLQLGILIIHYKTLLEFKSIKILLGP